jgi:tRNA(His) 5'-end guanylyltransferase
MEANNIKSHGYNLLNILIFSMIVHVVYFNLYDKDLSITEYLIDDFLITFSITYFYCITASLYGVCKKINRDINTVNSDNEDTEEDKVDNDIDCEEDNRNNTHTHSNTEKKTIHSKIDKSQNYKKSELSLPTRMKVYERVSESISRINSYDNYIIRIDGRCFSKFTKYFSKPFDENFSEIMLKTANNLLHEFHPTLIHVQSDEISMVFKKAGSYEECNIEPEKHQHVFGGRISKLLSVSSSLASSKFYHNLGTFINNLPADDDKYTKLIHDFKSGKLSIAFDSRVIVIPEKKDYEIINYMFWRSTIDGFRNAVSMYASSVLSTKQLDKLSTKGRIEKMKDLNLNFDEKSNHIKFGWFIKNMTFNISRTVKNKEAKNKLTDSVRKTPTAVSFKLMYSDEIKEQFLSDSWNDDKFKLFTSNFEIRTF